jgi:hypothetical protein
MHIFLPSHLLASELVSLSMEIIDPMTGDKAHLSHPPEKSYLLTS